MKLSDRQKEVIDLMRTKGYYIRWNGMKNDWEFIKDSNVVYHIYLPPSTARALVSNIELIELRLAIGLHKIYQLTKLGKTIQL